MFLGTLLDEKKEHAFSYSTLLKNKVAIVCFVLPYLSRDKIHWIVT